MSMMRTKYKRSKVAAPSSLLKVGTDCIGIAFKYLSMRDRAALARTGKCLRDINRDHVSWAVASMDTISPLMRQQLVKATMTTFSFEKMTFLHAQLALTTNRASAVNMETVRLSTNHLGM
jgi:hypothetical protein